MLLERRKFSPGSWYFDRAVGSNTLRNTIKELAKKAGLPGFYSNRSVCSTCYIGKTMPTCIE